jgi:hypothetical protein
VYEVTRRGDAEWALHQIVQAQDNLEMDGDKMEKCGDIPCKSLQHNDITTFYQLSTTGHPCNPLQDNDLGQNSTFSKFAIETCLLLEMRGEE